MKPLKKFCAPGNIAGLSKIEEILNPHIVKMEEIYKPYLNIVSRSYEFIVSKDRLQQIGFSQDMLQTHNNVDLACFENPFVKDPQYIDKLKALTIDDLFEGEKLFCQENPKRYFTPQIIRIAQIEERSDSSQESFFYHLLSRKEEICMAVAQFRISELKSLSILYPNPVFEELKKELFQHEQYLSQKYSRNPIENKADKVFEDEEFIRLLQALNVSKEEGIKVWKSIKEH